MSLPSAKLLVPISVLLLTATAAGAPEMSIDHREAATLMRALAHDRLLPARAGADVHIGVLGKKELATSDQAARAMTIAFQDLSSTKVQGLPVTASLLGYSGAARLGERLARDGIDVLYICSGLETELADIVELTRQRHVLSIAGVLGYLDRGVSLGVFTVLDSPTVFVNLGASKKEGAAFGSELLRLARVIR